MAIVSDPTPQRLQKSLDPVFSRFPPDNPVTSVRSRPEMGKPKEIECAIPFCSVSSTTWLSERDQPRLLGMNRKPKAGESLRQHLHNPAGICFIFKTNDKVIGKSNQKTTPFHPWLNIPYKPVIQYMM